MKSWNCSVTKRGLTFSIQGIGASPGFARGKAIVISGNQITQSGESKITTLKEASVVVMRTPDPRFVMEWCQVASGFVFETGGRLCHAALLCLELGIPCIVGATGVLERLTDDSVLELDGVSGKVSILEKKNESC
jgi:phosphoenolpyruvate synthase/pyruvate phosphate dikinase